MDLQERPAATVKLISGRLCLDFVNTVSGRTAASSAARNDKLKEYADLLAWSQHAGVLEAATARRLLRQAQQAEAAPVFRRAVKLREAIYRLCRAVLDTQAPRPADLVLLNAELTHAQQHERLVFRQEQFVWLWRAGRDRLDQMLWPLVWSAAEFLTTGDRSRLRECGGENCGWLFEDTSRNGSRQWCVMEECGNLAKVRRFRARQARR
jgi:predicted RNA-binding Zn ribbon-like protein